MSSTTDCLPRLAFDQKADQGPVAGGAMRHESPSGGSTLITCHDVARRPAMARPDIAFTVEHGERRILSLQADQPLAGRVAQIVARELEANGVAIDLERGARKLTGSAGLPTYNRGVADHQYLFVNGRPAVYDGKATGALAGKALVHPAGGSK